MNGEIDEVAERGDEADEAPAVDGRAGDWAAFYEAKEAIEALAVAERRVQRLLASKQGIQKRLPETAKWILDAVPDAKSGLRRIHRGLELLRKGLGKLDEGREELEALWAQLGKYAPEAQEAS